MPHLPAVTRLSPLHFALLFGASLVSACQSSQQRAGALGAEAQQLYDAGRYFEAGQALQRAVAARDDMPELWLLLGRTRLAQRDFAGAYSAYNSALDLDRANREALAALAQLSLNRGDFASAEKFGSQIQALDANDVLAALVRGYAAIGEQRYADAEAIAAPLLAQDPRNVQALTIRSMVLERQGDPIAALAVLAPVRDQNVPDLLAQLRRLYERTADSRALLTVLQRQSNAQPGDANIQLALAKQEYLLGRASDGAARLAALLAKNPGDDLRDDTVEAWTDLAADPAGIIASVRQTADTPPDLKLALAQYLLGRGLPREAAAAVQSIGPLGAVTPADADRQGVLALAEVTGGQAAAGAARAAAVLAVDTTQPYALLAQARAALLAGNTDEALRDARVIVRDNPRLPLASVLLADVYRREGQPILADRAMDDGRATAPDRATVLAVNLPRLAAEEDRSEAMNVAQAFTIAKPASMLGWTLRARVCAAAGDTACARRAAIIRQRLGGSAVAFPRIPDGEAPSDGPQMSV